MALSLTSPAFSHNQAIPARYTCQGEDINPPLIIENVPSGTQSLTLIVDDPDAPDKTWVHWIVFNIHPATAEIKENTVPDGAALGRTDFGTMEWSGPCPPSGEHRYFFKLYALDTTMDVPKGASKEDLESAMQGHIIDHTELIGLYQKL